MLPQYDNSVYCRCKGTVVSELFVRCDGEQECPNGQWLHPQCTSDLRDKSKEQLDSIEQWYCEDCVARIHKEEQEEEMGKQDEEMEVAEESESSSSGEDDDEGEMKWLQEAKVGEQ